MAFGTGHFDSRGNACLKLHLCGVAHEEPGVEFEGIIDTGFTGFIQLPIQHAFSLKLPLEGTAQYTLADGSQTVCLTALARTTCAGKKEVGVVTLAMGSQDILIGMEFLRRLRFGLMIFKSAVTLIDEVEVDDIIKKQVERDEKVEAKGKKPDDVPQSPEATGASLKKPPTEP